MVRKNVNPARKIVGGARPPWNNNHPAPPPSAPIFIHPPYNNNHPGTNISKRPPPPKPVTQPLSTNIRPPPPQHKTMRQLLIPPNIPQPIMKNVERQNQFSPQKNTRKFIRTLEPINPPTKENIESWNQFPSKKINTFSRNNPMYLAYMPHNKTNVSPNTSSTMPSSKSSIFSALPKLWGGKRNTRKFHKNSRKTRRSN